MLKEKRIDREQRLENARSTLARELEQGGIKAELQGRVKHIYSISRKMGIKTLDFNDLYDIQAIRVLVQDVSTCYRALSILNDLWKPIISEFDDSQILKSVLSLPNSISKGELSFSEAQIKKIIDCLGTVIERVIDFRKIEGENTLKDLKENLTIIKEYSEKIEKISDLHKKNIKDELEIKSQNLEVSFDNGRLEQEVFYYLEKMDINEELVRLKSHMSFFIETLDNDLKEKGKKLGFICQEIGREINTIGSKSSNSDIQKSVVEMKSCLEKIKEQTLNIL